jgi:DNA recombination protein RmuC
VTDNTFLFILLFLLAVALVASLVVLLRRKPLGRAEGDPALSLMQQQITALGEQVNRVATHVPQEVAATLGNLMGQVGARLAENVQSVQKVGADTGKIIAEVSHRLGVLSQSNQQILQLGQDIRELQQIFRAPKVRGGLGELSLGTMLADCFPAEHFTLQSRFKSGDIVDALLRLPGGSVSIDSKFPLAGFRARLAAENDDQRAKAQRAFARDVRKHVDDIADKYILPAEGTLDFALMYIPAESVFYDVIVQDEAAGEAPITDYALKRRVIPVSPNTLYAYLRAVAYGLMGLKIEERARDILQGLQQLQGDFAQFEERFELGQKHLRNAQTAFGEAAERSGRIAGRMEQFARLAKEPAPEGKTVSR